MRILITGCRGFVGSSFGLLAHQRGHDVLGVANSSQAPFDWPGRFASADVSRTDLSEVIKLFQPQLIVHAAGSASVGASIQNPTADLQAALITFSNLLESLRRSGLATRVLFPSSAAVYGNPASLPVAEQAAIAPVSPYGFHKAAAELLAREYAQCFGLDVVICRLFSVYGERQHRLLVWELYNQLVGSGTEAWLQGTGHESRDYLHMDDVSEAFLRLGDPARLPSVTGQCHVFNLASGEETTVMQLASKLRDLVAPGKAIKARGEHRAGDPLRWCADVSALHRTLPHWSPRTLERGLQECVQIWQGAGGTA